MSILINDLQVQNTLKFKIEAIATEMKMASLIPSYVSPVLKTKITIQLEVTSTDATIVREDFQVDASKTDGGEIVTKRLRVLKVDNEAKTIDVMFGGAPSGEYIVDVRHK